MFRVEDCIFASQVIPSLVKPLTDFRINFVTRVYNVTSLVHSHLVVQFCYRVCLPAKISKLFEESLGTILTKSRWYKARIYYCRS
jgi:hypothetical protein